jgi:predicted nucleic acid-binding protein
MKLFVDKSALVKYYYPETDSGVIERILLQAERVYLCELSLVEFASALMKKIRMNQLQQQEQQLIWEAFISDLQAANIELISLFQDDFRTAADLILKHGENHSLRTHDSLQLAAALKVEDAGFLSSDGDLIEIADTIGLSVTVPTS